jgi:lysophospholipase L1-like esterase
VNDESFIDTLHLSPSGNQRMADLLAPALGAVLARRPATSAASP